jgi:hypothetical protein
MPVSHIEIEASNNAITQIATGETATAQAQLPPSQTFDHASSSIIQTQSIQSNNQKPSYSTTANQGLYYLYIYNLNKNYRRLKSDRIRIENYKKYHRKC